MTEIKMPMLGLTMEFGTVTNWLKKEGDEVKKGEAVLQIETEKLENDVEAPEDGILLKIVAAVGEEVPVQGVVGYIGAPGEKVDGAAVAAPTTAPAAEAAAPAAESASAAAPAGKVKVKATPVAKKLAAELGVDLTTVKGTGPEGRITREDVQAAAAAKESAEVSAPAPAAAPVAPVAAPVAAPAAEEYELVPYIGMRKRIGENMSKSWTTAPKVTHQVSVPVAELLKVRAIINDGKEKADKVSVTDILVFLMARSLKNYPSINCSLTAEGIKKYHTVNMGVAVATEKGLLVPVVRDADKKSVGAISRELKDLVYRARNGQLTGADMTGATFTISNLGAYGSVDYFTPIINQPESAILGVGRTVDTPVAVNGEVKILPVMGLSLSYDHRLIDGAVAAEFMADFMKKLDQPLQTLLGD